MKYIFFVYFILIYGFVYSQNKTSIKQIDLDFSTDASNLIMPDSISVNIPIFKADECLYGILDSIINVEIRCPSYRKEKSIFYINFKNKVDTCKLYFRSSHFGMPDYSQAFGIFIFRDIRFVCIGELNSDLLHKTALSSIKFQYKYNQDLELPMIDDSFSEWTLIYTKSKFYLGFKRICEGYK